MTEIREYLVRTPDGHDYGRDENLELAQDAADRLGEGAQVIALDGFLLPIRENGIEKVVYEVAEQRRTLPCVYRSCTYQATDASDLDEHLISMPTEAPEHRWASGALPRRTPGMFTNA